MKKTLVCCLMLCLLISLPACGANVIQPGTDGVATGEIGDTLRTLHFDFSAKRAYETRNYDGFVPPQTQKLVVVTIRVNNTSATENLTFEDTIFQLQWGESGFADTIGTARDGMAPVEQTLAPGEKSEFDYVFSVPKEITIFQLCYIDNNGLLPTSPIPTSTFYVEFTT